MLKYSRNLLVLILLGMGTSYAQKSAFDFMPQSPSTFELGASFWQATNLIEVRQGSELSQMISMYSTGGYESAYGAAISFSNWYKPKGQWVDSHILFMSQLNNDFGILWGLGTGEFGNKYNIDPSIKLGFVYRFPLDVSGQLYLRATTILGGHLKEKSCIADYGQIGGVREVNCRLAAGVDAPEDTLKYLMNQKPYNQNVISVVYKMLF